MLTEIKNQFYQDTLETLISIQEVLPETPLEGETARNMVERVFTVSHQVSGTGPMLGFDNSSLLSKKLERTFYEIRSGKRTLTAQVLTQTQRTIQYLLEVLQKEQGE